jgi:hypothetical protein
MYLAGHLLASITLAKVAHKPLGVKFFPLVIAAMSVNLVDADHLIHYYRDGGTGNSFLLHPLHQTWAFLGLGVCLLALVLKQWQNLILGIFSALMLHYGLDVLANLIDYNLKIILGLEILCIALLILLFWKDEQRWKYYFFFVSLWLVYNAVLGYLFFVLHWQPHETRGIYLSSVILNLLVIVTFWVLFVGTLHATPLQDTDHNFSTNE